VLNLRRRDFRLDAPCQVRLNGKGNKSRLCPIWPATARLPRNLMEAVQATESDPAQAFVFTNARDQPRTRFGVHYLLRKYVTIASSSAPTLRDQSIHPHSLRHTMAIALLNAGVDSPRSANGWDTRASLRRCVTPVPIWTSNGRRSHRCFHRLSHHQTACTHYSALRTCLAGFARC